MRRCWTSTCLKRRGLPAEVMSLGLDIRRPDDLAPFRDFAPNKRGEFVWRTGERIEPVGSEARTRVRVVEGLAQSCVERRNRCTWRSRWREHAIPAVHF